MSKVADMIEEKNEQLRQQLQANVQISHNWKTAVASGEYRGNACLHIATLLDFLEKEHKKAAEAYLSAFPDEQPAAEPSGVAA